MNVKAILLYFLFNAGFCFDQHIIFYVCYVFNFRWITVQLHKNKRFRTVLSVKSTFVVFSIFEGTLDLLLT